jgi:hypothetical protein
LSFVASSKIFALDKAEVFSGVFSGQEYACTVQIASSSSLQLIASSLKYDQF